MRLTKLLLLVAELVDPTKLDKLSGFDRIAVKAIAESEELELELHPSRKENPRSHLQPLLLLLPEFDLSHSRSDPSSVSPELSELVSLWLARLELLFLLVLLASFVEFVVDSPQLHLVDLTLDSLLSSCHRLKVDRVGRVLRVLLERGIEGIFVNRVLLSPKTHRTSVVDDR